MKKEKVVGSGSFVVDGVDVIEYDSKLIEYNKKTYKVKKFEKCPKFEEKDTVKWIKIIGFSDVEIQELTNCFNLHPLVVRDIKDLQHPKIVEYKDYLFLNVNIFEWQDSKIISNPINIILGLDYLISIQEKISLNHILDEIEQKIGMKESLIRNNREGFLLYSILQIILDSYFDILDDLEDKINTLEKELIDSFDKGLIENPHKKTLKNINNIKKDVITIRKGTLPLNVVTKTLITNKFPTIDETSNLYLKDVHEQILQIFDMIETFRELSSGIFDTYISSTSNNLNEVVRVLTIITVLFVPLTFLTGFFGMNFQNAIPIFSVDWIYYLFIGVMIGLPIIMLYIFKKYNWY